MITNIIGKVHNSIYQIQMSNVKDTASACRILKSLLGQFYNSNEEEITQAVDRFLSDCNMQNKKVKLVSLVNLNFAIQKPSNLFPIRYKTNALDTAVFLIGSKLHFLEPNTANVGHIYENLSQVHVLTNRGGLHRENQPSPVSYSDYDEDLIISRYKKIRAYCIKNDKVRHPVNKVCIVQDIHVLDSLSKAVGFKCLLGESNTSNINILKNLYRLVSCNRDLILNDVVFYHKGDNTADELFKLIKKVFHDHDVDRRCIPNAIN